MKYCKNCGKGIPDKFDTCYDCYQLAYKLEDGDVSMTTHRMLSMSALKSACQIFTGKNTVKPAEVLIFAETFYQYMLDKTKQGK